MSTGTFLPTAAVSVGGQRTLPQAMYVSPEHFAVERARVFGRRWRLVMRESDLAGPRDYRVVDLDGESIIVLRDQDGVLRAFFNLCRHRGTRLCDNKPNAKLGALIQCP